MKPHNDEVTALKKATQLLRDRKRKLEVETLALVLRFEVETGLTIRSIDFEHTFGGFAEIARVTVREDSL